jgi:phosphoribosylanthranilate isomerase
MHRTRVKICGITRIDDGIAAVRAGADAIGLVFWAGSPRNLCAPQAQAIASALPLFVSRVGLFVDPEPAHVRAMLAKVPLDVLQFHGRESAELCASFGRPYVKAMSIDATASDGGLLEYATRYSDAAGLLFDAPPADGMPGGTGRVFDWDRLSPSLMARIAQPVVLSGGLHAGNVAVAIARVRPFAVDVSSGVEAVDSAGKLLKGIKDPARIAAFIEEVRNADVRSA